MTTGSAVLEVTDVPYTGCKKFVERFGQDAMLFYNSPTGRPYRLRGADSRVVQAGSVRVGDLVAEVEARLSPA